MIWKSKCLSEPSQELLQISCKHLGNYTGSYINIIVTRKLPVVPKNICIIKKKIFLRTFFGKWL